MRNNGNIAKLEFVVVHECFDLVDIEHAEILYNIIIGNALQRIGFDTAEMDLPKFGQGHLSPTPVGQMTNYVFFPAATVCSNEQWRCSSIPRLLSTNRCRVELRLSLI